MGGLVSILRLAYNQSISRLEIAIPATTKPGFILGIIWKIRPLGTTVPWVEPVHGIFQGPHPKSL